MAARRRWNSGEYTVVFVTVALVSSSSVGVGAGDCGLELQIVQLIVCASLCPKMTR